MLTYRDKFPQGTPKAKRECCCVGDVFLNSAKCNECGDILTSDNRHDFNTCSCGNLSVDGGSWYLKRLFKKSDSYTELSISYEEDKDVNPC